MTKILLVEDDKSLREIYSVRLLAEGYTLISSGDGEEALAAAIGEKPDLIVSDVMMPKISGFEMLDLLRSNDSTKNIPVIMLTALSSEQQRERGNRLGADRYLIKSQVGIEDIVRTVHEVLGDANKPRNLSQMQDSLNQGRPVPMTSPAPAQQQLATPTQAIAQPQPSLNNEPIMNNPSITGSNFAVAPAEPNNFQSSFNPPAATNPAKVAGQSMPKLPDTPLHIPTRTVQQPGMPASYNAALQSAASLSAAPLVAPVTPTAATALATPTGQPVQARSIQQAPAGVPTQPAQPMMQQSMQPATMPRPVAPSAAQMPAAIQYQSLASIPPQPVAIAQPPTPVTTAQPGAATGYQPQTTMAANVNQMPANASAYSGAGGERVITPPPAGAVVNDSPKINIDELLASADTAGSTADTGLFPGASSN